MQRSKAVAVEVSSDTMAVDFSGTQSSDVSQCKRCHKLCTDNPCIGEYWPWKIRQMCCWLVLVLNIGWDGRHGLIKAFDITNAPKQVVVMISSVYCMFVDWLPVELEGASKLLLVDAKNVSNVHSRDDTATHRLVISKGLRKEIISIPKLAWY